MQRTFLDNQRKNGPRIRSCLLIHLADGVEKVGPYVNSFKHGSGSVRDNGQLFFNRVAYPAETEMVYVAAGFGGYDSRYWKLTTPAGPKKWVGDLQYVYSIKILSEIAGEPIADALNEKYGYDLSPQGAIG